MTTDAKNDEQAAQRHADGRFAEGNAIAKGLRHPGAGGNPALRRVRLLQWAVYKSATPEHVASLMRRLFQLGMAGDVAAARVYLDRACGKPRRHEDDHRVMPPPSALCVVFHDQRASPFANGHRDLVEGAVQLDPPDSAA